MSSNEVAEALRELLPEVRRLVFWTQVLSSAVVALAVVGVVALGCDEAREAETAHSDEGDPGDR